MFVVVVVLLWSLTIIFLVVDFKSESNRWLSLVGFLGGFVGIYHIFEHLIGKNEYHNSILGLFSILSLCFAYPFLMYSLSIKDSYRRLSKMLKNVTRMGLLIPPVLPFFLFKLSDFVRPMKYPIMLLISLWAVPYVLIANLNLIKSYLKETNFKVRIKRLSACILFLPNTLIIIVLSYILVTIGYSNTWRYIDWGLTILLTVYFILATKNGLFGFKLTFKMYSLDDTMKVTSVGTSLLNHAIKNEALKINLCAENLKKRFSKIDEGNEELKIIISSTTHMLDLMVRIQEKTQEIFLIEGPYDFNEIIENALHISQPILTEKKISLHLNLTIKVTMLCDKVHIAELICNIIKNSVEAMPENGVLLINLYQTTKQLILAIQDNGTGISRKNISHVMEPFFSTKKNILNFGLGLSYSYNVMKKHKGSLDITSEENKDTLVMLRFPMSKVIITEIYPDNGPREWNQLLLFPRLR